MRISGERVSSSRGGWNPAWQRHVAEYALVAPLLPPGGDVADLGCGVGHSFRALGARRTVGVDIEPAALAGQDRETIVADIRDLPFPDSSFDGAVVMHSLEHVPDPERVVAEAARIVRPGGVAIFNTPNRLTFGRPDEVIDPFHYIEFDRVQLEALCRRSFEHVEIAGIFGSARYLALHDEELETLDRLLRWDPMRLRRAVPRRARMALYNALLRRFRAEEDERAAAIGTGDFELRHDELDSCVDLLAICTGASG